MSIRIRIYPQYGLGTGTVRGEIFRARRQRARLARQQAQLQRQQSALLQQRLRLDSLRVSSPSSYSTFGTGIGYATGIGAPYAGTALLGQPCTTGYGYGYRTGYGYAPSYATPLVNPFASLVGAALLGNRFFV